MARFEFQTKEFILIWFCLLLLVVCIQRTDAYIPPYPVSSSYCGRSYFVTSTGATKVSSSSAYSSNESTTSPFDEEDEKVIEKLKSKKKTLYEILDSEPSFTRAELKKRYVALAKITHPDAKRNIDKAATSSDGEELDFSEIAAAWRILSDEKQRKRYDRSLRAEEISDNISAWVGDLAKQAGPVMEGFGNVANNFLRKTTATTLAGVQAAANRAARNSRTKNSKEKEKAVQTKIAEIEEDINASVSSSSKQKQRQRQQQQQRANNNSFIGDTFKSAVDAAMLAGRKMDSLELLEKSEALEERALKESDMAARTKEELQIVMERRLDLALHTPGSGLSAADALTILEDFNKTIVDDLTPWDRAMLRHTIEYEIQELKKEEGEFVKAQMADTTAQSSYRDCVQTKFQLQQQLVQAEKAEARAREAWERAKDHLFDTKEQLSFSIQNLAQAESQVKKSDWEMEFRALTLERQAEKVRNALRHKQKQVRKELGLEDYPEIPVNGSAQRLQELEQLRNEERLMAETSSRLELMAERLFERAQSLRERAQELDRD